MAETGDASFLIIDASPLISVLKIERFDLFSVLPGFPVCTEHVRADVQEDIQKARLDSLISRAMIRELQIVDPVHHSDINDLVEKSFGYGEASSMVLARFLSVPLVMDDKRAIKVAQKLKIQVLTMTDVVVENIRQDVLTVSEADQLIADWRAVKDIPVTVQSFGKLFPPYKAVL